MLGGLRSAIINEVLQFVLIWAGAAMIPILGLIEAGGWTNLKAQIAVNVGSSDYTHLWSTLGSFKDNPDGRALDGHRLWSGLCDQLWILDDGLSGGAASAEREQSARGEDGSGDRRGVQDGGAVHRHRAGPAGAGGAEESRRHHRCTLCRESVAAATGQHSYNEVLPLMLIRYCGPGLLGLGITALVAGFMSGMAGNVSAFSTVWTYDIYGAFINKKADDKHYVLMGRWSTVIGMLVSIGTAYLVMNAASIMDYVQALFSFFIAPLFGTVILGMLWKRATHWGGFLGLLAGTAVVDRHVGLGSDRDHKARCGYIALSPRCASRWRRICTARCGAG